MMRWLAEEALCWKVGGGSIDQRNQQRLSDFGSQSEVDLETLKERLKWKFEKAV